MSQNDYSISDQGGQSFLNDLNDALQADQTNNAGTSAPSTTYQNQWWVDDTNNLLKIRNKANSAWVTIAEWDGTTWRPYANGEKLYELSAVAADFLPDADSTRDLGSASKAWAEAHADKVLTDNLVAGKITDPNDDTRFVAVGPYVIEGVPRSCIFYAQLSNIVRRSINVTSVIDDSTGEFTINFTNAMTNSNHYQSGLSGGTRFIGYSGSSASSPKYDVYNNDGTPLDNDFNSLVIINDLA